MNTLDFSKYKNNKKSKLSFFTLTKFEFKKFTAGRNPAVIIFRIGRLVINFIWGK